VSSFWDLGEEKNMKEKRSCRFGQGIPIRVITIFVFTGIFSTSPAIGLPMIADPFEIKTTANPAVPEPTMSVTRDILAVVNGKILTKDDFEREVANLPEYARTNARIGKGKKELLDTMIFRELILEEACLQGVDKSSDVAETIAVLKKRVVIETYLRQLLSIAVTEEEVRNYYNSHKEDYISGEDLKISKIVVKEESEANSLLERVHKGGKFEALAEAHSIDSSALAGGDLGWIRDAEIPQEFMDAIFASTYGGLKAGEVSQVFRTSAGFTIVKVTDKRESQLPYEKVKYTARQDLIGSKQHEIIEALKVNLKNKAKIVVFDP